jgi:hypothetical protein
MENFESMVTSSIEAYEKKKSAKVTHDPSQKPSFDALQAKLDSKSDVGIGSTPSAFEVTKSSEIRNLACLAQTLSAYLITVNSKRNSDRLKTITVKLYDAVNLWLSRLFR